MALVTGSTLSASSPLGAVPVETFYIGKTEVTWGEWKSVRTWAVANGYTDLDGVGEGAGENFPVRSISWYEVVKWCNARSEKEGKTPVYKNGAAVYRTGVLLEPAVVSWANGYRLPSDSEWEFAARGGTKSQGYTYSGSDNMTSVGWYVSNSGGYPQEVGKKQANELGVYDMSGDVWEWCQDWSPEKDGINRVIRGGAWNLAADGYSVASWGHFIPEDRNYGYTGFRVALSSVP
jgi:sulfatase modifying factor 1